MLRFFVTLWDCARFPRATRLIITGASKDVLEEKVKPAVAAFLNERGLELSSEKTKITSIEEGFDFLGFNVRKYAGTFRTKPAKASVKRFLAEIRGVIKANKAAKTEHLIRQLNPKIRGWANYYRHGASKKTFNYVDHHIFLALHAWVNRRHPNKSAHWKHTRYFRDQGLRTWVFFAPTQDQQGNATHLNLVQAGKVAITRHIKIRGAASPYDPAFTEYFQQRACSRRISPLTWDGGGDGSRDPGETKDRKPGPVTGL